MEGTVLSDKKLHRARGPDNGKWKGGRFITRKGYVVILIPDYHRRQSGRYVLEHVYLMEQHLGRWLKRDEVLHHRNGNKQDNRIENLQVMTNSEHVSMHNFPKRVDHTNRICYWCGNGSVRWERHGNDYLCHRCGTRLWSYASQH